MAFILVIAGAIFALLFVLNALVSTLRQKIKIGFWELLLAFLAALVPLAGAVMAAMEYPPQALPLRAALVLGGALLLLGALLALLESHREQGFKNSRGVMGAGIGLLLMASTFTVPLTSERILLPALATITPINVSALQVTATVTGPTATPSTSPSPTFTTTPTLTRTPRPTGTATATRFVFMTRTPEPTATLPSPCLALTLYNVNLRAEPSLDAELKATIAFDNTIALFERSEDSEWWYGSYEEQGGWVKGEFLDLSTSCDKLPVRKG
ncbi:MAG: SH3 domain-containing protein [Anaerolineae bacterium]